MGAKVTLEDLAKQAGVHRSTVSLALRDHPRISPEVRRRIQALAAQLGYRMNPLVAALMQSRRTGRAADTATLAFVTNYPTRDGWRPTHHDRPDYFPGAVARARELGYNLEHFWRREPGMTSKRFCDILWARGIHGLIVGRLPPGEDSLDLEWQRFSCVAFGMTLRSPLLHHVTENHFDTVWQSMQRCRERGYRRVGFVFSEANDSPRVGDRWLGAFLAQQQSLYPPEDRVEPCISAPPSEAEFRAWLRRERPDALVATHGRPALRWLERLGLAVPRDIGLVQLERHPGDPIDGVFYEPGRIGALAVDMLIGMLHRNEHGVPSDQHEVLLVGAWYDGTTLPERTG